MMPMKDTPIRTIEVSTPSEIAAVAKLAHDIWHEHYPSIISIAQIEYMLERFQSPAAIASLIAEGYRYFLIERDKVFVGYIALHAGADSPDRMLLSKFYIRHDCRGQGLGVMALNFAEAECRRAGCRTLWLTVNKANPTLAWYERHGFTKNKEVVVEIGEGYLMDDFIMEKTVYPIPQVTTP